MSLLRHWKIALLLVAVVAVSGTAGGLMGVCYTKKAVQKRHDPTQWHETVMRYLESKLKLTPDQKTKVEFALDQAVDKLKVTRVETIAATTKTLDEFSAQIEKELTPEQKEIFQKIKEEKGKASLDLLKIEPKKK
jgi:Spy/CpxP family protein refolding chaperone